jgi:hypothetical protein
MAPTLRIAVLLAFSAAFGFAEQRSGSLVDSKCYASEERNVNPTDTLTSVDRDGNREIRFCSPSAKTKSFALVHFDGRTVNLDSAGNAKASELVRINRLRTNHKTRPFFVTISGEMVGEAFRVDSISAAPQP